MFYIILSGLYYFGKMFNIKLRMSNCIYFKCDVVNMCIDIICDVMKIFCVYNVDICII